SPATAPRTPAAQLPATRPPASSPGPAVRPPARPTAKQPGYEHPPPASPPPGPADATPGSVSASYQPGICPAQPSRTGGGRRTAGLLRRGNRPPDRPVPRPAL